MASTDLEKHSNGVQPYSATNVDERDEPSARWGWHGTFPKGALLGGIAVILILVGMLTESREGHISDIYLVVIALIMLGLIVRKQARKRTSWRE
ncbi:MAG: DUF2631 domain-containing protein [Sciscionella sp.]